MARISYDQPTADAFKAVREVPRGGLREWREAVRRHLQPSPGTTLADIGAGTGAYSAAFSDWFGIDVVAIEPSAAMREQIPRTPRIRVLDGDAGALPLPDDSADAGWLSLVIHHIPDLEAAAHEIRRVLRPGAPVLIRQGYRDRYQPLGELRLDGVEIVRWTPRQLAGSSTPSRRSSRRWPPSQRRASTSRRWSRFVTPPRSASRSSWHRWTPSAGPTPPCAG